MLHRTVGMFSHLGQLRFAFCCDRCVRRPPYAPRQEELMEPIKTVLEKLRKTNLCVSIKKSSFHMEEAEYRQGCLSVEEQGP